MDDVIPGDRCWLLFLHCIMCIVDAAYCYRLTSQSFLHFRLRSLAENWRYESYYVTCMLVGHNSESYSNGWTNHNVIWGQTCVVHRNHELDGSHIGTTWLLWLNNQCAVAMQPYVKLFWGTCSLFCDCISASRFTGEFIQLLYSFKFYR